MGARTRGFANNVLTSGKLDATDGLTGNLASTNFANATVTNIEELPPAVGSTISSVAGNPAAPVAEGKIWYNTSTDSFNIAPVLEAWSSGANLITGRADLGGTGTQTAALGFGGYVGPGTPNISSVTEEYNGSGWSSGGTMGTGRRSVGEAGTQTAGLAVGGTTTIPGAPGITNATEEYDGSAWTAGGNLNTGRLGVGGLGLQTAAVAFGGASSPFTERDITEEYNGTSWTAVPGTITSARRYIKGCGTQTAGLGTSPTGVDEYDGTSWTAGGTFNTGRPNVGSFAGIQTSAIMGGGGNGGTPNSGATESYDGSTWTTSPATMATGRYSIGGAGSSNTSSLGFGGTGYTTSTEEYNKSVNVITAGAWASGGNLNDARRYISGFGIQTAALGFGGFSPGATGNTESYDGTSWTEVNNLGTSSYGKGAAGTQAAGLAFGGSPGACESWDGSSWTSSPALNTDRRMFGSAGLQTAALAFGGRPEPSVSAATEEWDGSSWTSSNDLNTARRNNSGAGSQTAALGFGGYVEPAGGLTGATEEYDGTSWTTSPGTMNTGRMGMATNVYGTQSLALAYGGTPPATTVTESWNGTSWITSVSMATARGQIGGAGTNDTSALAFGGSPPSGTDATEEFTGETSALNVESLTTS